MSGARLLRALWLSALAALPLVAEEIQGQTGAIVASARGEQGTALVAVEVVVLDSSGRRVAAGLTARNGRVRLQVPEGVYVVMFRQIGRRSVRVEEVRVEAGASEAVEVVLTPAPLELEALTVTASRRAEKLLDAPASVAVVDRQALESEPALSVTDHVEGIAGVDVMRTGIQEANIVVRGFNSLLTNATLTLIDNRPAEVPALRNNTTRVYSVNTFDLDRIEVVRGPGSAMYGLDAAQGVVHMITKSPIDDPGYEIAVASGLRRQGDVPGYDASTGGIVQIEGRVAQRFSDRFGAKLSGRWFSGEEWRYQDTVDVANQSIAQACLGDYQAANPACQVFAVDPSSPPDQAQLKRIGIRKPTVGHWTLDGRADWRPRDDIAVVFNSGLEYTVRAMDLSAAGMAQVQDHITYYADTRLNWADFYGQVYFNKNKKVDAQPTYFVRNGFGIPDESWNLGLQLQHATAVGPRQQFVYGGDLQRVNPDGEGSLHGIYEDHDAHTAGGAYLQSETRLGRRWDLSLALRSDWHSILGGTLLSPRAALVFSPGENHRLRVTYNRAFRTPTALAFHGDVMAQRIPLGGPFSYDIRLQGAADHLTFGQVGGDPAMRSPWAPLVGGQPVTPLPATTAELYIIARELLRAAGSPAADLMDAVGVPASDEVAVDLRMLNLGTGQFDPLPGGFGALTNVPALKEETTTTYEMGYKGFFAGRLQVTVDGYYTRRSNYLGPFLPVTPNVFLNGDDLVQFFTARGVPVAVAQALAIGTPQAPGLTAIPLGVASLNQATSSGAGLVLATRNWGDVDVFGADLELGYRLGKVWEAGATLSWASDNLFDAGGIMAPLNAPRFQTGLSLGYDNRSSGLQGRLGFRHLDGFPAADGVFAGQVDGYNLVDLNVGFRVPGLEGARVQLEAQNLMGTAYSPFPGVPTMGRLVMTRLEYRF